MGHSFSKKIIIDIALKIEMHHSCLEYYFYFIFTNESQLLLNEMSNIYDIS